MDAVAAEVDMAAPDDQALMRQAMAGRMAAFDQLMRRHNQRLYRAVRSILRNEADAEEAVQDAWVKIHQNLTRFRAEALPATWMTRIAVNEALMRYRRNKRRAMVIESSETSAQAGIKMAHHEKTHASGDFDQPDQAAWRSELRIRLEAEIDALPEKYRSVFMLLGVEALSGREAAEILDLPEATVRVRFMRARRQLQRALQADIGQTVTEAFSFAGARCDRIVAGVHARLAAAGSPDLP